jgi:hypothetical protein
MGMRVGVIVGVTDGRSVAVGGMSVLVGVGVSVGVDPGVGAGAQAVRRRINPNRKLRRINLFIRFFAS